MKKKLLAIIGSFVLSVFAVSCSEEDDKSEAETVEYSHALPLADSIYVPDDADDNALEQKRLELQESLKELDNRIAEEYDKVYWHGLWRRRQK